jgi:hypothetical protein
MPSNSHLSEGYLVVTQLGIQKTQELTPGSEVHNLIDSGKREMIFRTCLVQAFVISTHPPFPIIIRHKNWIDYPIQVLDLLNETGD